MRSMQYIAYLPPTANTPSFPMQSLPLSDFLNAALMLIILYVRLPNDDHLQKRCPLSQQQKRKVLDMLSKDKRIVNVPAHFKLNKSMIRAISLTNFYLLCNVTAI